MLAYVSYCESDFNRIKSLLLHLGNLGYSVNFEQKMPAARTRWKSVLASIRACDVFLLALTETALKSESRRVEYDYALCLGKPVLTVLFTDMQVPIPDGYTNLLDCRPNSPQRLTDLRFMLRTLPRPSTLPAQNAVIPNWLAGVSRVQTLIARQQLDIAQQEDVVYHIREALERQETLLAGELLLDLFAARDDLDPTIQAKVQPISRQIRQSYTQQRRTWWQNVVFTGVILLVVMGAATFFLSRRLASTTPAVTETIAEVTQQASFAAIVTQEVTDEGTTIPESTATLATTSLPVSTSTPAATQ